MPKKPRVRKLAQVTGPNGVTGWIIRRPGRPGLEVQAFRHGALYRFSLGTMNRTEALAKAPRVLARIKVDGTIELDPEQSIGLTKWLAVWLRILRARNRAPRTLQLNLKVARRFRDSMNDAMGGKTPMLHHVTPERAEAYFRKVAHESGAATANQARAVLMGAFNLAVDRDRLPKNPLDKTEALTVTKRKKFWPSFEQVETFLAASLEPVRGGNGATMERDRTTHDVALLIANAGLRAEEAVTLRWQDLDMAEGLLFVRAKPEIHFRVKDREERSVRINDALRAMLLKRRQLVPRSCPWAFPTSEAVRPWARSNLARSFRAVAQACAVKGLTAQSLRRFFARAQALAGKPAFVIRDLMGHSSLAVTEANYIGRDLGADFVPVEVKGGAA